MLEQQTETIPFEEPYKTVDTKQEATDIIEGVLPVKKERLALARENFAVIAEQLGPAKEDLQSAIAALTDAWEKQNAELLEAAKAADDALEIAESELRETLVDWHRITGQKTFDEHLSVRVSEKLEYEDDKAVDWALLNAVFLVKRTVDKKAFENIAKSQALPFVNSQPIYTAVIAKDLNKGR